MEHLSYEDRKAFRLCYPLEVCVRAQDLYQELKRLTPDFFVGLAKGLQSDAYGFTGDRLQALMYQAILEVCHDLHRHGRKGEEFIELHQHITLEAYRLAGEHRALDQYVPKRDGKTFEYLTPPDVVQRMQDYIALISVHIEKRLCHMIQSVPQPPDPTGEYSPRKILDQIIAGMAAMDIKQGRKYDKNNDADVDAFRKRLHKAVKDWITSQKTMASHGLQRAC
ncbi:MAG: hypothetical protein K2Q12_05145 [Rickettsiales bacterium]|nr:hypothetical protein [Rickettsiales bacterium]